MLIRACMLNRSNTALDVTEQVHLTRHYAEL